MPTNCSVDELARFSSEDFQLFRDQLEQIRNTHKGGKHPLAHVLGDFNFKDSEWPGRCSVESGPSKKGLVTDRNTKLCCQGFILALF